MPSKRRLTGTAVLVRHAHAEWPNYAGRDFDRPLTARGEAEALQTARAIRAAGHQPGLLLASPARRTRQTARILADEMAIPDDALRFVAALYNAPPATLEAELRRALATSPVVMLVAHNPGISELARELAAEPDAAPFKPAQWRACVLD